MEQKENVKEVTFNVWETDWSDLVGDEIFALIDKFHGYETGGTFKVTIVFVPEDAVEDV